MRMYLVHTEFDPKTEETHAKLVATSAEAASERKRLNSDEEIPRAKIKTDEVDVPTSKAELIAFLNKVLDAPLNSRGAVVVEAAPKKD